MSNEIVTRYAPLAAAGPSTFDPATRTMRAVIAAGAEVERYDARGRYVEVLDHKGIVVPPGGSVPLLNSHRRSELGDVLGSATDITAEGANIEATLQLSSRDDVAPIAADIAAGHIRGVSIGYRVLSRNETTDAAGGRRVTATRWEVAEVSLVPIPADPNATIREAPMPTPTEPTAPTTPVVPAVVPPPADTATRAAINAEIRTIATVAGLERAWADQQIDAGATADAARAAAFEAMRARTAPIGTIRTATVTHDHTDPTAIRSAMADALAHRLAPGAVKLEGRAVEYRGMRILEMVGELASASGERFNARDQDSLLQRAVGAHSTADFPLLLADAANKSLLAQYAVAAPTYRKWAARKPFVDFKDHQFLRAGDFPAFREITEAGEVKYGTISENAEKVRAKEYGTGIAIGRRALINDDLSALSDFSSQIAIRAAADENKLAYGVLAANGALSDGKAIFDADHGNLAAAGAAIDATSVALAVAALRAQKSLDGLVLNLQPAFLVVGPAQEVAARQILAAITPTKTSDVNVWAGFAELVVDANIAGNEWYLLAAPSAAPVVVFGYVGGSEGPQVRTDRDFDTQAVKIASSLDFGVGAIDFRGAFKNSGA